MIDNLLFKKLKEVTNYQDLFEIALLHIQENKFDTIVLGPIFSMGSDHVANNLLKLEEAIKSLETAGEKVFSQVPFLDLNLAQDTKILHFETERKFHEFYFPLFKSGLIKNAYFLPGWEESRGASWEHSCCLENNITIKYL